MSDEGVDEEKRTTLRRFAALGAASPLTRLGREGEAGDASDSDAREAIVGYLGATPGAHFSKIRDDLRLGTGETQYHLRRLEERSVVESRRDGDYRRFFPAGRFSAFEQVALGYLRRETARGLLVALLRNPEVTGRELADRLDVSRPTISKYVSDLEREGLLSRGDGYRVEHPETVLLLLVRYADSFGEEAVALAADANELVRFEP